MMQEPTNFLEILRLIIQWGVVPLVGFVWLIHKNQQNHSTDIAVLKAVHEANKEAHDREFKEMRESFKAVLSKLEGIEQHLRK
jgi:hypothetical protein